MHHLAHTTLLLDCQHQYENSFSSFIFGLSWKVCLLGSSPSCAADRVSHSKMSVSNPSYLSRTVPWMEVDSENYDGWL